MDKKEAIKKFNQEHTIEPHPVIAWLEAQGVSRKAISVSIDKAYTTISQYAIGTLKAPPEIEAQLLNIAQSIGYED